MWGASANPDSSRANSRRTRPASPTPTSLADSVEANAIPRPLKPAGNWCIFFRFEDGVPVGVSLVDYH